MRTARSPESFTYQYATTSLSIRYSAAHTLASTHALLLQVISVDGAEHEDETAQNPAATDHVFIRETCLINVAGGAWSMRVLAKTALWTVNPTFLGVCASAGGSEMISALTSAVPRL